MSLYIYRFQASSSLPHTLFFGRVFRSTLVRAAFLQCAVACGLYRSSHHEAKSYTKNENEATLACQYSFVFLILVLGRTLKGYALCVPTVAVLQVAFSQLLSLCSLLKGMIF